MDLDIYALDLIECHHVSIKSNKIFFSLMSFVSCVDLRDKNIGL